MIRWTHTVGIAIFAAGLIAPAGTLLAQVYGGGTGGGSTGATGSGGATGGAGATGGMAGGMTGGAAGSAYLQNNYHLGFNRPEAWGLKYFASASLLSGLQPSDPNPEGRRVGSITIGFEAGYVPMLDAGQQRIGYNGKAPEDLNKAPIFARPVIRVTLPWKLTAIAAAPPPFEAFGVTSHMLAFGLERPIVERHNWSFTWRGYGQLGSVKGAFTCPKSVLSFAPGSPDNPTACVGESSDVASLRYAGMEFQFAHRLARMPKLVPHVAVGGNFIDGVFQVHAPVRNGMDETRLWTRGGTFSGTAGASYWVTQHAAVTIDAFYSPLWVQRSPTAPTTNDGLFNVRAMLSYTFR